MSYRPKHCEMFSFNTEIFALKSSCKHPLEIYSMSFVFISLYSYFISAIKTMRNEEEIKRTRYYIWREYRGEKNMDSEK